MKRRKYLSIEERREIIYSGKKAPICMSSDDTIRDYIVPIHGFVPSKYEHKKAKKIKL